MEGSFYAWQVVREGEAFRGRIITLPEGLSPWEAMILGTAGFTAALGIWHMIHDGLSPEKGPVLVAGAVGGDGTDPGRAEDRNGGMRERHGSRGCMTGPLDRV